MSGSDAGGLLGIFPGLNIYGGVPVSGLLAWRKIVDAIGESQQAYLFCYAKAGQPDDSSQFEGSVFAASRFAAIAAAISRRWRVETVLVWHLHMLKLLPFFHADKAEVILFLHGMEAWRRQNWLTQKMLRRVKLILSNSEFTWQRFVEFNPDFAHMPHKVVPLGIGDSLKDETPPPLPTPIALMVGRLDKDEDYKGHREMIGVWPKVVERLTSAELWIVGDGSSRSEFEELAAKLGLQDKVRFFGKVTEARKQEMLSQCRCLAMPSRGEGFGLVYVEAMRLGRPCLVSTFDAGREVVNPPEAGLMVDLSQQDQLVESICRLLTHDSAWEAWSARARRRYEALYTAEHFQNRLVSSLNVS
jgi:glycosyltransferase involved in cell wall biosynthesis